MFRRNSRWGWLALVACSVMTTSLTSAANLLRNGDFEAAAERGAPSWSLTRFHQSPEAEVQVARESPHGGHQHVEIRFPVASEGYCLSFYQTLPDLEVNAEIAVSCWYRLKASQSRMISLNLSGGPGCALPCGRCWLQPVPDNQWHEVKTRFNLRSFRSEGMVLEFGLERTLSPEDVFSLDDVTVEYVPGPTLSLFIARPAGGVLWTDDQRQSLTYSLRAVKSLAGARIRLRLSKAGRPESIQKEEQLRFDYPKTSKDLDLRSVPEGKFVLQVEMLDREGQVVAKQTGRVVKVRPGPKTIRVRKGTVYRGGEPILPLGLYHVSDWALSCANSESQRIGSPTLTREQMLDGIRDHGFNCFFYTAGIPPADFLSDAAKRGLWVIPEVAGVGTDWGGEPLSKQVATLRADERLLGWGGWDEPVPGPSMERAAGVYRELKAICPQQMVVTSVYTVAGILSATEEATFADLILHDNYPIRRPDADLGGIGQEIRLLAEYTHSHPDQAAGATPQAFVYGGPEPTPEQVRCQTYSALVNGARAFFYYSYVENYLEKPFTVEPGAPTGMSGNPLRQRWFLPDSALWGAFPGLFRELNALKAVILADNQPDLCAAVADRIQFTVREVKGALYLIAVNPTPGAQEATFRFPTLAPNAAVEALFSTRPAVVEKAALLLKLSGYEVAVFRLRQRN